MVILAKLKLKQKKYFREPSIGSRKNYFMDRFLNQLKVQKNITPRQKKLKNQPKMQTESSCEPREPE